MLEFLTVVGLVVLLVVAVLVTTVWLVLRRIHRSRLVATARTAIAAGAPLLAGAPTVSRNPAAALRMLRLTRAQQVLRRSVADAARTGAYVGDVPAMLPRLQAETDRLRTALGRLPSTAGPAARNLLAAADRHLASLRELTDAVVATATLPAVESTLSHDAEEAAHGLRLYAAAYAELTGARAASGAARPVVS